MMNKSLSLKVVTLLVISAVLCFANDASALLNAVKRRDHKALTELIKAKADVNVTQPDGATALAWAIYLDDQAAAEMLLAAGARVNTADEYGETPLTLACNNGNVTLVQKLIAAGADAKAARWDGSTVLMLAANAGKAEIVKLLLDYGAPINAYENKRQQTALMWAASEGHTEVVRLLVANGADAKARSKSGYDALMFAMTKNDAASIKALLAAGANPNVKLPDGTPVLIAAAAFSNGAAAIALIEGGADVKVADARGNTALHTAAQTGDLELVNKLLTKGADSNARNAPVLARMGNAGSGFFRPPAGEVSPIHLAAKANQIAIVKALLAAGADPKIKGEDGTTLLMQAAGSANVEMAKLVYDSDKDVKAVTTAGDTAMHAAVTGTGLIATQSEICKVVRFLAEIGVPLDERNTLGRTPIDIADRLPIDQAVDLLTELILKSGAKPKTPTKR